MSTIRTATFLHAQQRIRVDASNRSKTGKTNKRVKCNPPNKKCGSRCIPADWDCRLTGEGSDPHLLAAGKGSDPLAAIANLQRGAGRIFKGLKGLNPSELEGGRKAIIRGVVKGSPGNIQDKEQTKANLVRGTIMLGAIASVGVLGIRGHGLMMGVSVYKKHIGQPMEDAAEKTIRRILDRNPITGPGRQAVRQGALRVTTGRTALYTRTPEAGEALSALGGINPDKLFKAPAPGANFDKWYNDDIKRVLSDGKLVANSTDNFLTSYYKPPSSSTTRNAGIARIREESEALRRLAEQNGVDRKDLTAVDKFAKRLVAPMQVTPAMRGGLEKDANAMLTSPFDAESHFVNVRNRVAETYRGFYKEVGDQFPDFYKPNGARKSVGADRYDFTNKVVIGHARLRASVFQGSETMVKGSYTADLTHLQYFKLAGKKSNLGKLWTAPRGLILEAAKEVGSSKPKTIGEAIDILRINGFKGIDVETIGTTRPLRTTGVERAAKARGFKLRPDEQQAYDIYSKQVESELLPNGDPKYKTPDEIRRKVQGLIAKDRVGKTAPPKSSTVAPRPSATRPKASARRPGAARAALPVSPERKYPGWAEDNIEEFTKLQKRFEREARKVLTRPGYKPTKRESMELAARWMQQNGWLTDEPSGWPGGNFDSADRSDAYLQAFWTVRHDKKCGESGIAANKKCSKKTERAKQPAIQTTLAGMTTARVKPKDEGAAEPGENKNKVRNAVIAGALGVGTAALLLKTRPSKIAAYRKNVAKSAVAAEAMSHDIENKLRADASRRLGKPVEKVTGFEASAYNFKDKAQDTGFGAFNDAPHWFGQTKNSRGSVVVLSYADNDRGQGGYNLVKGGAFNKILGEHDLLPFANRIGQPNGAGSMDYVAERRLKKTVGSIKTAAREKLKLPEKAADKIGTTIEGGVSMVQGLKRFKYLRDNVNERGFNPDAVRAAAFVVAQRRLTGKPVHMLAYSNGGNVAVEALKILEDMGYKDVKVVNVAGPAFGIFENSRNNLRTWVSKGDEFWKFTGGKGFAGGNTKLLDDDTIPHELEALTHPSKPGYKEALKAKKSYMLNEQLQREAYTHLTVDTPRAIQIRDEFLYKAVENKPFDGDIGTLFGDKAQAAKDRYYATWKKKGAQAAKDELQDDIEQRMIDTWYGGYKPAAVKKRQKELRAEFEAAFKESEAGATP